MARRTEKARDGLEERETINMATTIVRQHKRMTRSGTTDVVKHERGIVDKIKYKGRFIFVQDFDNATKAYVPYGNNTAVEPTRAAAIAQVKREIDERERKKNAEEETFKKPFATFKHFYYSIKTSNHSVNGGTNVGVQVYRHTPTGMEGIGSVKWNTAGYKGEESEVLDYLKKIGEVPAYMFPNGYYSWSAAEKYNMKISRI